MNRDMGLHVSVFCNCYETGNIRIPPPQPELVYIDEETGQVSLRWDEPGADQHRFHEWLGSACEHGPTGQLVFQYLGNIARISFIRELFEQTPKHFPLLLSKVVYNGIHCGDSLTLADVENIALEMALVGTLHCADPVQENQLRTFEAQMEDLIQGARSVQKPIVF